MTRAAIAALLLFDLDRLILCFTTKNTKWVPRDANNAKKPDMPGEEVAGRRQDLNLQGPGQELPWPLCSLAVSVPEAFAFFALLCHLCILVEMSL